MLESPPDRTNADETPYQELDGPVVPLCRALNSLPGIWTIGSCGGHPGGGEDEEGRNLPAGELPEDQWRVTLHPELQGWRPTLDAWLSLEFVAWVIDDASRVKTVDIGAHANPPYLNDPAHMLRFTIFGVRDGEHGITPEEVAGLIDRLDPEFFRP
jgi:hypothetical protein